MNILTLDHNFFLNNPHSIPFLDRHFRSKHANFINISGEREYEDHAVISRHIRSGEDVVHARVREVKLKVGRRNISNYTELPIFIFSYLKSPLYRSPGFTITLVANLGAVFGVVYFSCLEQPALIAYPTVALMGLGLLSNSLAMLSSFF